MFTHKQTISPQGMVYSVQTLTAPMVASEGLEETAGKLYFLHVYRVGFPLIQTRQRPDGGGEILALGLRLLSFSRPIISPGSIRYPIESGLVVQKGREGQGHLQMAFGGGSVSLMVDGYYASLPGPRTRRIRTWFYNRTQAALHVHIARGYLPKLAELVRENPRWDR